MKKILPILIAVTFGLTHKLEATHMMGADMSYKCTAPGKYHITAKIYRDCRGVPFNGPSCGVYAGTNGSNSCGNYSIGFTRTGIRDVTPRCSTANKPCNPVNTGFTGEGIEEHTYEADVDFSKSPLNNFTGGSCCEVTFYVGQCCRNGAITTGPANQDFWTTCMLNICNVKKTTNKCNSSPQLSNEPIGFLCCNQAYYFNNGAIDTVDFDSFSYRLVAGLNSLPNNPVTYASPWTYYYPMTPFCTPPGNVTCKPNPISKPPKGFYMDTSNGDVVFTPTKCDEVGILVIEILEWRKDSASGTYLNIGKTRRDMQLIVKDDCGYNKAPTLSGNPVNVCEGDKVCFDIEGKDETFTPYQTIPDTVQLKWNKGIPGATFTIKNPTDREKTAEFCWQTAVGQASDIAYTFTVTATDDHCPKPSASIKAFKVKVKYRAYAERTYTILKCGRFAFAAKLPGSFKGVGTFKWSLRDSNPISGQLDREFHYTTKQTDTISYYEGKRVKIVLTVNNSDNCPTIYSDTVDLPAPPTAILATADTFACFGTNMTLTPKILHAKSPYRYYWTRPIDHTTGDTLVSLFIKNINRDSIIQVRITDGDGCKFYDTANIFVKPLPVLDLGPDQRICTYETATFDAQNADTLQYLWNSGDTTRYITKHIAGDYIVTLTENKWYCKQKDTVHLFVNDTVISKAGADKMICTNDKATLNASHSPSSLGASYAWTNITTNTYLGTSKSTDVTPKNSNPNGGARMYFQYQLKTDIIQGGHQCTDMDTMTVTVNPLPKVKWIKPPDRCWAYGDIVLNPYIEDPVIAYQNKGGVTIWAATSGMVECDNATPPRCVFMTTKLDNNSIPRSGYNETIYLKYTDSNGCSNTATTIQKISPTPLLIMVTRSYCQDLGSAQLKKSVTVPDPSGAAFNLNLFQSWRAMTVPDLVDSAVVIQNHGPGDNYWLHFGTVTEDFYAGTYEIELCVQDKLSGCSQCDTGIVKILSEPIIKVSSPAPLCLNDDTLDLTKYVIVNGQPPLTSDPGFSIISKNGVRTTAYNLSGNYKFPPSIGPGVWEIKYSTASLGCTKADSFSIIVNDTPRIGVRADTLLCAGSPLNLDNLITMPCPSCTKAWSGPRVIGSGPGFDTKSSSTPTLIEGPFNVKLQYTDQGTGCKSSAITKVSIRTMPTVIITTPKPGAICAGDAFSIISVANYTNGVQWTKMGATDGTIDNPGINDIMFTHGTQDAINQVAWLKITTTPEPKEVCPMASDSIQLIINPYPVPAMKDPLTGCVPLTGDFFGLETSGIPNNQLTWDWDFGNGQTSTVQNPTGITYPNNGYFDVTLKITNTQGNCMRPVTMTGYVEAYPIPVAAFSTDPKFYTTIALPKFQMINESQLDKTNFTGGSMSYLWNFGTGNASDISTEVSPKFNYGKDTNTYTITLTATSDHGCTSTVSHQVKVGPDIIVFIPNVFTPDELGPNTNNTFIPVAQNYNSFRMMIYNRWGEKMYETDDINKGWDGRANGQECMSGVYVYHVEVTSYEDKLYKFSGTTTLLR